MRPCGDSMNTSIPLRPRIATSADEPVSPEVAPRIVIRRPARASAYSNSSPRSWSAMSLNARVGPWNSSRIWIGPTLHAGAISGCRKLA